MSKDNRTEIGGDSSGSAGFDKTDWSELNAARTNHSLRRKQAIGRILGHYWKPVYCYLRRKGCNNERAKDLTQAFFCDVVLPNELVQQAQREKGHFRSYLLTALNRYTAGVHRREIAQKRRPSEREISLDGMEAHATIVVSNQASPDQVFAYTWAAELVAGVIAEVQESLRADGKEAYWRVFNERVICSAIEGTPPTPLPKLCDDLGIENEAKASAMIVTAKRRFQAAMRRRVCQYTQSDENVEREITELMEILSNGRPA